MTTLVLEQPDFEILPLHVKLFKLLDEEKKKNRTRSSLLDAIRNFTPYLNLPEGYEIFLLELYLLNFRKDGDYSKITKENFVDPRKMRGKWTPNTLSDRYTMAQLPFKGSNLEGYWSKDLKGVPYYIVKSYGWYPIYIFKDNQWYETVERYSSSTGRQMSNSNPVMWDDALNEQVLLVSQKEMKMLMDKATKEDILKNKLVQIKRDEEKLKSSKIQTREVGRYRWFGDEDPKQPIKIKFKIGTIDTSDNETALVNVDIYDVLKMENYKQVDTPENYLKGELKGITPQAVEDQLERHLKSKFKQYIGPRFTYYSGLPKSSKVKFVFNHLKK